MAWTVEDVVTSAKRRASIPTANATFTQSDFIAVCNEELQTYIVPLITSCREDFFIAHYDVSLTNGTIEYRLPSRAVGSALVEVSLISSTNQIKNFPRLSRGQLEDAPAGFYLDGNVLMLGVTNPSLVSQLGTALRMTYQQRPGTLVATSSVATVASINALTKTVTTSGTVPTAFTTATKFDIIRAKPGFEWLGVDMTATAGGTSIVFADALPGDLAVGDTVSLAGESNIPQVPAELHPLLAQRVALKCLEGLGDKENMDASAAALGRMEQDAVKMLTPRVVNENEVLVNRASLFRTYW